MRWYNYLDSLLGYLCGASIVICVTTFLWKKLHGRIAAFWKRIINFFKFKDDDDPGQNKPHDYGASLYPPHHDRPHHSGDLV